MKDTIDAYYQALKEENWDQLDILGPRIWKDIERALGDKHYAAEISPAIVYLLSKISQYPEFSPHGIYHGQTCLDGALKIVKLLSLQEALPEVKRLKETYYRHFWGTSQDLVNDVLSHLGLSEETAREVIQRKQRSDVVFGYTYSSLTSALSELRQYYLPNILRQPEDSIKSDPRYAGYVNMPNNWHPFEGLLDEAYEQLSHHLTTDHPDREFSYSIQSDSRGLLTILANTKSTGEPHFVWRTLGDKYILLLSDFS